MIVNPTVLIRVKSPSFVQNFKSISRLFHSSYRQLSSNGDDQIVRLSQPFTMGSTALANNYRLGYDPIYSSPTSKFIALSKRVSLAFGFIGIYVSHLIHTTLLFPEYVTYLATTLSVLPLPMMHLITQHYVVRIFRLYDKEKLQTLENLTDDETLIAEKISFTGRGYYNTMIKVKDLKIVDERISKANWRTKDGFFYIVDNVGGIKMDRIWGIAEHNSGIDNGRYFGK